MSRTTLPQRPVGGHLQYEVCGLQSAMDESGNSAATTRWRNLESGALLPRPLGPFVETGAATRTYESAGIA